jgi:hypothetical protein
MTFGKGFRPVLTPGGEIGSEAAGARSAPMTERSEVTRSDRQRPAAETVISAAGCGSRIGTEARRRRRTVRVATLDVVQDADWRSAPETPAG